MTAPPPPTYDDVMAARARIAGHAHDTPVFTSRTINDELDAEVYFKCENFQRTGSFKFRGAVNALAQLDDEQRHAGVVAFSSGNHAQAIALAAHLLRMPATIVMPHDAPANKVAATREYGGKVVIYDRFKENREEIGRDLAKQHGLSLIPPYDHRDIISGQGTAACELLDHCGRLDMLFVPLGGGGLLAGSSLAVRARAPGCEIYGVEPEAGNDGQQSFRSGTIVHIDTPRTIADGAQTQHLGSLTFPIIQREVNDVLTVSDAELAESMFFFATRMKMLVEPTGCLGFAAARRMKIRLQGRRIGVIISGGNVDMERFCSLASDAR